MSFQTCNTVTLLNHLTVIRISGEDAGTFLQGQLTCDIRNVTENNASIAAFCNPKGRVISTLLIFKDEAGYGAILPCSLSDTVLQKLRRYVLRSKVLLEDASSTDAVLGFHYSQPSPTLGLNSEPLAVTHEPGLTIALPSKGNRFWRVVKREALSSLIDTPQTQGFVQDSAHVWRYAEILAGIPWFEIEQSEQFIPQMLNIDGLGGISFNKGCYTGQEIVARTHFLGKSKRQLFVAKCDREIVKDGQLSVLNSENHEKRGDVLSFQNLNGDCRLLIVLQTIDEEVKRFILDDELNTELTLLPSE